MNDTKIVDLFLNREEKVISVLTEKYGKSIRGIAFNVLRNIESAEECENDTYLVAWNTIPPKEPRTYLFAYLSKIVRNIAIDRFRKEGTKKRNALIQELSTEMEESIPASINVENVAEQRHIMGVINQYLAGLSEEKRNVFVRRYFFCDSIGDISERFGYSKSKIKSMLMRCRKELHDLFMKEDILE